MKVSLLIFGIMALYATVIDLPRAGSLTGFFGVLWLVMLLMELSFLKGRIEVLEKQLKEMQKEAT